MKSINHKYAPFYILYILNTVKLITISKKRNYKKPSRGINWWYGCFEITFIDLIKRTIINSVLLPFIVFSRKITIECWCIGISFRFARCWNRRFSTVSRRRRKRLWAFVFSMRGFSICSCALIFRWWIDSCWCSRYREVAACLGKNNNFLSNLEQTTFAAYLFIGRWLSQAHLLRFSTVALIDFMFKQSCKKFLIITHPNSSILT